MEPKEEFQTNITYHGQENNIALELSHQIGKGAIEALWSLRDYMGVGCYERGIPIFALALRKDREKLYSKGEGIVIPRVLAFGMY